MATMLQKRALEIVIQKTQENKPVKMGQVMIEAGFTKKTARNPQDLTKSKGWQELLAQIDDGQILKRITQILLDDDKRSSLTAADMLLKLKDKYPAGKLKVQQYQEELNKLND